RIKDERELADLQAKNASLLKEQIGLFLNNEIVSDRMTKATERRTSATGRATAATREHIKVIDEEARAYERAVQASQRYADSLNDQIRAMTMTQSQRTALEVRQQVAAAPTAELKEQIQLSGDWI